MTGFRWVSDREKVEQFVTGFGHGAPLVFYGHADSAGGIGTHTR